MEGKVIAEKLKLLFAFIFTMDIAGEDSFTDPFLSGQESVELTKQERISEDQ